MVLDQLPYVVLMLLSASISGGVALRAYQARRKVARAASFVMMALFASLWMLLVTVEALTTSLALKEILWRAIPFVVLNVLIGLFNFSLEFSLRLKRIPRPLLFTIVTLTVLITALIATNHLHHLFWTVAEVNGQPIRVFGELHLAYVAFGTLLVLGSVTLLVRAYLLSTGVLRRQTALLLVGIMIPLLVGVVTYGLGWNPLPRIDETAFSVVFTVVLFARATLQFSTFYLLPVASDVVIKNMQDGILVTDIDGLIIFNNPAAQRLFGKKEAQINGQPASQILAEWLPEASQAWKGRKEDVQLILGEEPSQFFRFTVSKLVGYGDDSIGYLLALYDNTEQKNHERLLKELAILDPLTGSYNRRYFYEMARVYFDQMLRSARPFSILMIDLDHFKNINDTYGHVKGDLVLQKVAAVCKSLVRAPDIFSRHGGEEFVLAMPETSLRNALMIAERLRRAIEALPNELEGIPITASMGVVETSGEADLTLDVLLSRADEAMYLSKHAGRNRVTAWR